ARGAWVVTIPRTASPQEQAQRAVRCAMALASTRPGSPVHVATGRVLVNAGQTMGEVMDRAAEALAQSASAAAAGVWIDAATAELVEGLFLVEHGGAWSRVVEEIDAIAPVRMLLGKPTPCVGREPQAAMLATMLQSMTTERRACAVVVTAAAGLGKTHLVHEFLRTAVAGARDVEVLVARGDAARAASPLGVLGGVLQRAAGIADSDGAGARARKTAALVARDFPPGPEASVARALVGELCGIRDAAGDAGSALLAARADPSLMADAVRETWIAWLGARASRGPVLLLLEDAHWADAPSLALVEDAVLAHGELPIFLLATARPGAVAWDRLRQGGLVEMTLAPLSAAVSEGLVRTSLGPDASPDLVRAIARRAGGHPFHLEELIRAAASGRGPEALPDSVLGMVQARFDALDARARRALRAASVFGDTFWSGGVAALMGDDVSHEGVVSLLGSLVDGEVVTRQRASRWPAHVEYRFRHALLREGAYATLADADRVPAHRRAAQWLEEVGESDPAVLAEHYDMGGAPERAVVFFHAAAEQSLHRNDLDRALVHAARARALGPVEAIEARLRAIEAEVQFWRGDLALAAERASDAARALPSGTRAWFEAVSIAIGALGQLGRNAEVAARLEEVGAATPAAIARGAQVIALARGLTQLFWAHHGDGLPGVRARLDELVAAAGPQLEAHEVAWVHRVRGESAWLHAHDAGRCLAELATSCEGFERAHATRAACLTRLNAASLRGWAGAPEEGLELAARARAEATKLGADFLLRYGRAVEGLLSAYAQRPDAEATMRDARAKLAGSPRLSFLCDVVVGWLALERADLDEAQARADAARVAVVAAELRPAGVALASRVLTARGRAAEAAALVEEAAGLEARLTDLELTWGMAGVALAEARAESGHPGARDALAPVLGRLGDVAATLASESERARFWSRPLPNARASALAARLGIR
ncbi:MAG TPA: AAA family ATPase, partial [Polyangiaceae bacterium]